MKKTRKKDIYCGNNKLNNDVVKGKKIIGTKYSCFKKGFGKGIQMKNNKKIPYQAIDTRKIYCGKKNILPKKYDIMGNLPMCLQKGIGVGKNSV